MRIEFDCDLIQQNAQTIVSLCAANGIEVVGVGKGSCGNAHIANAMLAGGVQMLGESRLPVMRRLRAGGVMADFMLLRIPRASEAFDIVELTRVSLNSEVAVVRALSSAAVQLGVRHQVLLMLEMGDRREGVPLEQAIDTAGEILKLPSIDLIGTAVNWGCVSGVMPSEVKMAELVAITEQIERTYSVSLPIISGGSTANLGLVLAGKMPSRVNQLRIGEGILLGTSVPAWNPIPGLVPGIFTMVAEVIEVQTKPSLPDGEIGLDAFGGVPTFVDLGERRRAIVAMGKQDLLVDSLTPQRHNITIVAASSDHTVLDVTDAFPPVEVGDELVFDMTYSGVATAMGRLDLLQVAKSQLSMTIPVPVAQWKGDAYR
jgi:predicted amino acid racemase